MEDYYTKTEVNEMIANLATKQDVKEVLTFMKNINLGVGVFKISIHTIVFVGSLIAAVAAILVVVKVGVAGIVAWAALK